MKRAKDIREPPTDPKIQVGMENTIYAVSLMIKNPIGVGLGIK
jgi:hypothetical protein